MTLRWKTKYLPFFKLVVASLIICMSASSCSAWLSRQQPWPVVATANKKIFHARIRVTPEGSDSEKQQSLLEEQQEDILQLLGRISSLKGVLQLEGEPLLSLENYQRQVDLIEGQLAVLDDALLLPPVGLTMDEYQTAMALFLLLPLNIRVAFCQALELENPAKIARDLTQIPTVVALLYEQRVQLTPQTLQDALAKRKNTSSEMTAEPSATKEEGGFSFFPNNLQSLLSEEEGKTEEEIRMENTVKNVMGRVTRKEGLQATQQDLDQLLKVLNNKQKDRVFVVSSTDKIPGGFVIRGKNSQPNGSELIQAIDAQLPQDFPAQVSFLQDITTTENVGTGEESRPVLVLLHKDMTPQVSGILTTICSWTTVVAAFAYCVGLYSANEVVSAQLSEALAIQDSAGVNLFTDRVLDVLLPLLCLQLWHDLAHFVVAKVNQMEMGFPTLLPLGSLPIAGTKTVLRTCPPNRTALFDFGLAGPLVGMISSLGCLAVGLVLTATADPSTLQFFPSLPTSVLTTSALSGSMADYVLGGGMVGLENRFITLQDPSAQIVLHPGAIAGFCGVWANALALVPLGSTDGGRLSLALLGRYGHSLVGGFVWISLLIASLTLERPDILIAAWLVNNIVQNDMEIPCRDETQDVNLPRVLAALSVWFLTLLAVIPLPSPS